MRINTNISSMRAQEYLRQNQDKMDSAMNRLSSGKRINSAADDAAGLAIATRMRAKESSLNVASRNTQDAMSLAQTSESALGSISNILVRMRDLATQAANGTNSADDKDAIDTEYGKLKDEITHIAEKTTFNGVNLLNGAGSVSIQLSDAQGDTMNVSTFAVSSGALALNATLASSGGNPSTALTQIDAALKTIATNRADLGATLNRLDYNVQNINSQSTAMAASASQIEDADMAKEMSEMTKFKILSEAGISMLSQANQTPQAVSKLLQ